MSRQVQAARGCTCGVAAFPTREAAQAASATQATAGRERRCPTSTVWHVPGLRAPRLVRLPAYSETDDEVARRFIVRQLERPQEEVWAVLLSERYVRQTARVLDVLNQELMADRAGKVYPTAAAKAQAAKRDASVQIRRRAAREAMGRGLPAGDGLSLLQAKLDKQVAHARHKAEQAKALRVALRDLTLAVSRHECASGGAAADAALWRRLREIEVPFGTGKTTLIELVGSGRWTPPSASDDENGGAQHG